MHSYLKNRARLNILYSPYALRDEEGICVRMGWTRDECVGLAVNSSFYREIDNSSMWMLGVNRSFPVRILIHPGTVDGHAFSIVQVYFKGKNGNYDKITDFTFHVEDDIFAIIDRLDKYFEGKEANPEIAKEWKAEMATMEDTIAAYASLKFDREAFIGDSDEDADNEMEVLPPWLDEVVSRMRFKVINGDTPLQDLTAFVRFYKSWDAWMAVTGKLAGGICLEAEVRIDNLGWTINSKIPRNWVDASCVPYVALFYQLLPVLFDHFNGHDSHNIDVVKSNGRWTVNNITTNSLPVSYEIADLFFDVRREAARLPKVVTPYMKERILALLADMSAAFNSDSLCALRNLTLKVRWSDLQKTRPPAQRRQFYSELVSLAENDDLIKDPDAAYAISRLFLEFLSDQARDKDKSQFYSKIRDRIIDGMLDGTLSDTDLFNLAAAYLEYKFTKCDTAEGRDISTFFRDDYDDLMAEIKQEKKADDFDLSFDLRQ